jgi:uncharacterized protein (DUF2141 family)
MRRGLLALLLLTAHLPAADADDGATLTLRVEGFPSTEGRLLVVLFDQPDGFPNVPDKAARKARVAITTPVTTVRFEGLPAGRYAVFAFHDENGNDDLDVRWGIPIPKEPFGASRGAKIRFGPPKFDEAAFVVGSDDLVEPVRLARYGSQ